MGDQSAIQWTDATWQVKGAAAKVGIAPEEYLELRRAGLKFCWRCRRWSPVAVFGRDASRYDGLASACISCRRPPRQLPLITRTDLEYERARYAADPVYRTERRQRVHARKRGLDPVPVDGIEALTERFGGRCAYCPATATTWDHIVPVSKGGRTVPGNIVPACRSCNYEFIERYDIQVSEELEAAIALAYESGQTLHG